LLSLKGERDEIGRGEGEGRLSPLFRLTLNFRYSYAILSTPALCHLPPFPARSPSSPPPLLLLYHSSFAQPSTLRTVSFILLVNYSIPQIQIRATRS